MIIIVVKIECYKWIRWEKFVIYEMICSLVFVRDDKDICKLLVYVWKYYFLC